MVRNCPNCNTPTLIKLTDGSGSYACTTCRGAFKIEIKPEDNEGPITKMEILRESGRLVKEGLKAIKGAWDSI